MLSNLLAKNTFSKNVITINKKDINIDIEKNSIYKVEANGDLLYKFNFINKTDNKNYYLSIVNPLIDSVVICIKSEKYVFGDKVKQRNDNKIRNFNDVLPIRIEKDSSTEISIIIKNQNEKLNIKFILSNENVFLKIANRDNILFGIFIGVSFLFMLLLLCMYVFSGNVFFKKYMYMNLITIMIYIYFSGFGYKYIWSGSTYIQIILPSILFGVYCIMHLNFIYNFFNLNNEYKYIKRLMQICFIILLTFASNQLIITLFKQNNFIHHDLFKTIVYVIFFTYISMVIYLSINTYLKTKRIEAIWILAGLTIQSISWLIFFNNLYVTENTIGNVEIIESNIFISNLNILFIYAEILLTTIFITYNFRNIIKQNTISYNRLQFLQQRNLKEYNDSIIKTRNDINELLEKKILTAIRNIKLKFSDYVFFKEINKLDESIINNLALAETELEKIMQDEIKNKDLSLGKLIQNICDEFPSIIKESVEIQKNLYDKSYNNNVSIHIKRIIEEMINNILKHSEEKVVNIKFTIENNQYIVIHSKNKVKHTNHEIKKGLGLINIEERLAKINGKMEIINTGETWETIIKINTKNFE